MHDGVRNKQRSMSANIKTLKSRIDLRKQVLGLNYPEQRTLPESQTISVAELLTHFENLTAPAPLDGHGEPQLGTSGVIKMVYNTGIQLISRMQLREVHNVLMHNMRKVFLR